MDNELIALIGNFYQKFEEARDAWSEVMDYLEEHYDIDTRDESETIEDSLTWCYGIDVDAVEKLIEESKKGK